MTGRTPKLTAEKYAAIPQLLLDGKTKEEIAAMYGVTIGTLKVRCSNRGISLRPGGYLNYRSPVTLRDKPLTLSVEAVRGLRARATAMGINDEALATELLETIVKDDLFHAILDHDHHCHEKETA